MLMFSSAALCRLRLESHLMVEGPQVRTPDYDRATMLDGRASECSRRRSMGAIISKKGLTPDLCACQLETCPDPGIPEEVEAVVCDAEIVPLFPQGLPRR